MIELGKCYCMDNLELIKQIDGNSIDLIYCDILYNTGKKFKDFNDNLGDVHEAINWYIPRIVEMKRVLKDTGMILLQMDYRLVHYIKVAMDEILGIDNFINDIIWYYKTPSPSSIKRLSCKHDNILVYSKSDKYKINIDSIRGEYSPGVKKQAENKNIAFGKIVELNPKGKSPIDVWEIPALNSMSKDRTGYSTQKPKELVEKIVKGFSDEGDVVADFFCGSGTTGVVAKELGRNYILCDINPKAIEISEQRLSEI